MSLTNAERKKRYRERHPDRVKESNNRWNTANKDRKKAIDAAWRAKNPEHCKDWRLQNIDRVHAYDAERYKRNPDAMKKRSKQWRADNPERAQASNDRRRMLSSINIDSTDRELSIAYRKAIRNDACYYCGASASQTDHYFPLSKGGTDHWYNLVRACAFCNNTKRARCGTWFLLRNN